ncbi:MAG: hypothetical protein K5798_03430 [Nitrosopumilus sp.]|uniref:hypothetical protein n=1 Tax=Nitrosopumilus sp. TaxID=2024843 RepID=UPI00243282AD|nr:hypothetical protein [Nitrosopumilus sp.]MCV0366303.1 hypothetical protein [Nitrosopumilus sp.]
MKSIWQYQKHPYFVGNDGYTPIPKCVEKLTKNDIAKLLPIIFLVSLTLFSIFVFFTSVPSILFAYGNHYDREIHVKSIFTKWIDDDFHHVFAVCGSELIKGDIILISSDIAIKPLTIQDDETIDNCKTFDVSIFVLNPVSIKLEIITLESKENKIKIMEKKISSLENIVQRLFTERDELIRKSTLVEDNSEVLKNAKSKLDRISELIDYQKITSKKLKIISTV